MQHWIDRSGIANRPMPKLGLTNEEKAEAKRRALEWGLKTGAARDVVQGIPASTVLWRCRADVFRRRMHPSRWP